MMGYHIFVDNSNLWIEGKFASAVNQGVVSNLIEAHNKGTQDSGWRVDFGKLIEFVVEGKVDNVKTAILFGSKPPHNDTLWSKAKKSGFDVVTLNRNVLNKEKAIDTGIVQRIDKCLYREAVEGDIFILIAGDRDFVHSLNAIREEKMIAKVAFWSNAAGELIAEADEFINLMQNIDKITY